MYALTVPIAIGSATPRNTTNLPISQNEHSNLKCRMYALTVPIAIGSATPRN